MSINLGILASSRSSAPSAALLLDTYPGAAAAYSLRKLRTAYTGAAIRVRRSSDNTETDIGFDVLGELDTTALTTFVGAGNGFVTTWYDQTTSAYNLTQTTTSRQPQIVNAGSLYSFNTKPSLNFNGNTNQRILQNTSFTITQPNTTFVAVNSGITILNVNLFDGVTARQAIFAASSSQISYFAGSVQSSSTNWGNNINRLVTAIFNGTNSRLYSNNTLISSANPGTNSLTNITLGGFPSGGSYWSGNIAEIIFYSGNQSSNLSGINGNINTYYTIY